MEEYENVGSLSGFPKVSMEEWYKRAEREMGNKGLQNTTFEGIELSAIYLRDQYKALKQPDLFSFHGSSGPSSPLYIDSICVRNESAANETALKALREGSDGVLLELQSDDTKFDLLLRDVWLDNCLIALEVNSRSIKSAARFLDFYTEKGGNPAQLRGWISYDLLKEHPQSTKFPEEYINFVGKFLVTEGAFSDFNPITIGSHLFFNSGADLVQEMAYTLSLAVEHVETLRQQEIEPENVLSRTLFSLTVGTNYFFEISKLRAFRVLWSKIAEGYGTIISPSDVKLHTQTSLWYKSNLDKENNIIRNSAEVMAAIIGGSNFISVRDFDPILQPAHTSSRRIFRNISNILKEESFLNRVSDAAAGSYYVESLTHELAAKAWKLFLDIEKEGGFFKANGKGIIAESILESKRKKLRDLELRRRYSIGVNIFPNNNDKLKGGLSSATKARLGETTASSGFEGLKQRVEQNFPDFPNKRPTATIVSLKEIKDKGAFELVRSAFVSIGFCVKPEIVSPSLPVEKKILGTVIIALVESAEEIPMIKIILGDVDASHSLFFTSGVEIDCGEAQHYFYVEELVENKTLESILENLKG